MAMQAHADLLAQAGEVEGRSLWQDARRRLFRNKAAVVSMALLLLILLGAVFAPWLSPHPFDEIYWDVTDKETGHPRAKVVMRAGDVAAMPADIRHQGYSPKRSMLYVWENATPDLPERYERGDLAPYPIEF